MKKTNLILLIFLLIVKMAIADEVPAQITQFYKNRYIAHPFIFDLEDSIGIFTNVSNKVFKPKGDGPFPAVVLVHTAGGLSNEHVKNDAQRFMEKGYVTLVLDSMGPRGVRVISTGTPALHPIAGVKDAYIALDFLKTQSYVDKERIYQVGYSWGGFVATLLGSPMLARAAGATNRFTATASLYSTCTFRNSSLIIPDTDKPILMLIAGADRELSHGTCFEDLQRYQNKGMPITFHVYENASHGWDKKGQSQVGYIYESGVTNDAFGKLADFFEHQK